MAIIATEDSKVLVQGITGSEGKFRAERMKNYGTDVVAGTSPGKGGGEVAGVPVYDTVEEAKSNHPSINSVVQLIPAPFVKDAAFEVLHEGISYLVIHAEGVPKQDIMEVFQEAKEDDIQIIGPNCPGVISPGIAEVGATPHSIFHGPGKIGVVSCTGSIQWYISRLLSLRGWGQSTFVGIGGDPIKGTTLVDVVKMFEEDPQTEAIMMVSEVGGTEEYEIAKMIEDGEITKPMVAYIYGRTVPKGEEMGHAGAMVTSEKETVRSKVSILKDAGVKVVTYPSEVVGAFEEFGISPKKELFKKPIGKS